MICNPICSVGFFFVSKKFFRERIDAEEYLLYEYFKTMYVEYAKLVPRFPVNLDKFLL